MTPSEHEIGSSGSISECRQPELALRSSREITPGGPSELTASSSSGPVKAKESLSNVELRLQLTRESSSLSKPTSLRNVHMQSHEPSSIGRQYLSNSVYASNSRHKQIIVRSFAPRVAVFASPDTEEFVRAKGFGDGLHSLLRPYGERVHGKVVIRDSVGGSRGWDDFGIRFINSQALQEASATCTGGDTNGQDARNLANGSQRVSERTRYSYNDRTGLSIDTVLDSYLRTTGAPLESQENGQLEFEGTQYETRPGPPPLYLIYLRKLLSRPSIVPYETFSHPVACLIAVSSRHPAPIEALRQLYAHTGHEGKKIPAWMGTDYLRYYVLIHDEEIDDIIKSTALFDLMKRHFGLHCHLLRLRRSQCVPTDDDSTKVPSCEWLSAEEEIEKVRLKDYADEVGLPKPYILESDSAAIKSFIREMVTQSIVPFMESRVLAWNDQIASRRRGISGRFMSLSKRWTGFGTAKSTTPGLPGASNPSGGNYNYHQGFYPPETAESTMRQLGDYAFMLRDWKLAYSIYDILRADFGHDKAWTYHAAANEMAAITSLLLPHASNPRSRPESIDQMLETASYSYLTRCSMPFNVNRCLTIAIELLKTRGSAALDDAASWGEKLLDLGVLAPSAQALTTERIAESYMSRTRTHLAAAGACKRRAALWSLLASDSWSRLDKPDQALVRLREASVLYARHDQGSAGLPFPSMQGRWQRLVLALRDAGGDDYATLIDTSVAQTDFGSNTAEEVEQLIEFTCSSVPSKTDAEGCAVHDTSQPHSTTLDERLLQDDGFE